MVARRSFLLALLAATFTCIVVLQMSLDGWVLRGTVRYTVSMEKKDQTSTPVGTVAILKHNDVEFSNQSSSSNDIHGLVASSPISSEPRVLKLASTPSGVLLGEASIPEVSKNSPQLRSLPSSNALPRQEAVSNGSNVRSVQLVSPGSPSVQPQQAMTVVLSSLQSKISESATTYSLPHLHVSPTVSNTFVRLQPSISSSRVEQLPQSAAGNPSSEQLPDLPGEVIHENSTTKPQAFIRQLPTVNQQFQSKAETPNQTEISKVQARIRVRSFEDHMRSRDILQRKQQQEYISAQERLREIMNHGGSMHVKSRPDPLRSLRSIPTVKPADVTHVILLTYFRSGSTFVGDLLQQNWRTFYHFEPLHFMTYDSRIGGNKVQEAFDLFGSILRCNFSSQENYLRWAKRPDNQFLFERNIFLWFACKSNPRMCFTSEMVSAVCQRAPVQVMKVTRLNMRDLREFLFLNPDIKTKVVYLARDPRGIISSRRTLDWCSDTQCSDPRFLCSEMIDDIRVFNELQEENPDQFIQVLYEDIALYPEREAKRLFQFLGLSFSPTVQRFLRTHTTARKTDGLNPYSTRRNSSTMAFSWRNRLTFSQVNLIQVTCSEVIHQLNYSFINSTREYYSLRGIKSPGSNDSVDLKSLRNFSSHSGKYLVHSPEARDDSSRLRLVDKEVMIPNYREINPASEHEVENSVDAPRKNAKNYFENINPTHRHPKYVSVVGPLKGKETSHTDDRLMKNR